MRSDHHPADDLRARLRLLTPREREVLRLVVAGKTTRQIADELRLSPRTIEVHRTHILLKTQTRRVAELVTLATRLGGGDAMG